MLKKIAKLSATQFEELTYDLVTHAGLRNVVWRTPGADGGRDIEGDFLNTDFSGSVDVQRWHIECKHYSSAVSWPTVWEKISYAESNGAHALLLVTNASLSPACQTEVSRWNALGRTKVRSWDGARLTAELRTRPSVALKFGLVSSTSVDAIAVDLLDPIVSACDTVDALPVLTTAAAPLAAAICLARLARARIAAFQAYGDARIEPGVAQVNEDWVFADTAVAKRFDRVGLLAFAATVRYITSCTKVEAAEDDGQIVLKLRGGKPQHLSLPAAQTILARVATWSFIRHAVMLGGDIRIAPERGR